MTTLLIARLVQTRARALRRERDHALAIKESERFQTEILNSVSEPMAVLDRSGNIVQHNEAWESSIVPGRVPVPPLVPRPMGVVPSPGRVIPARLSERTDASSSS